MSQNGKPDFSNVSGGATSTEAAAPAKPDFSDVTGGVQSTEASTEGGGGGSGEQSYTVAKGDTLSHIAKQFYGKSSQWQAIYDANRDQLDDPDKIFPGQVLKIPAA
ncbi:MAG: LysM peptidoglycan-binding domain-containing protein [Lysobacteraceae bacterium]|nr:MAG: LysM peptidoglycan-binding domain-containing protein [Xanthomonadaceae bacterium]